MDRHRRIKHETLIKKGIELMKQRSIYEWAEYCKKNQLDLKTGKKNLKSYPKDTIHFISYNCNYYEYFNLVS